MATERINRAAERRLRQPDIVRQVNHSIASVRSGNPLAAEWDVHRLEERLAAKAQLTKVESSTIARTIARHRGELERIEDDPAAGLEFLSALRAARPAELPEKVWGSTYDFIQVGFLDLGVLAARAVARVAYLDGDAQGSGFMVSNRLFLTNNHVIPTPEAADAYCVEFDYQADARGNRMPVTRFRLDPNAFFLTDERDDLDYTLIAVGERIEGPFGLDTFGYCALSASKDKHALGEFVNIVQHPDGRLKELVLRENRLVARESHVLHYIADTEPGSSGSPVFNDQWQVVALHHWGGPWRQTVDALGRSLDTEVNEGIRISVIVEDLRQRGTELPHIERDLLEAALSLAEVRPIPASNAGSSPEMPADQSQPRIDADGRATWRIPIELSLHLPGMARQPAAPTTPLKPELPPKGAAEAARRPDSDYGRRSGYKPKFIRGHVVPIPELGPQMRQTAARNLHAEAGDDEFELRYHHFSIVMDSQRRLAFFTACNIDGRNAKKIDRKTGAVRPMVPGDVGSESYEGGAEGSENWYQDARVDAESQTSQSLYDKQQVAGFGPRDDGRLGRMLQRGHLVRRMDPSWGEDALALQAEADTFHFTNCVPQLGFFNQGNARDLELPDSGDGRLWRALEDHVLRNAVAEDQRVSCFTGPVFDPDDPHYRSIQVPMRFWKIVVWSEKGILRSLAMLADQTPVLESIENLPEAVADREAMDELEKVEDFLSTVREIEDLTGLDFGDEVRDADIRAGDGGEKVDSRLQIPLKKSRTPRQAATRSRPATPSGRKPRAAQKKAKPAAARVPAKKAGRAAAKPKAGKGAKAKPGAAAKKLTGRRIRG